jgi:hypothetical protein
MTQDSEFTEVRRSTVMGDLTMVSGGGEFEPEPERYRVDVLAAGERTWSINSITHETPEEAEAAARNLFGRWMTMEKWRVVPDSTPKREAYVPGSETGPS